MVVAIGKIRILKKKHMYYDRTGGGAGKIIERCVHVELIIMVDWFFVS